MVIVSELGNLLNGVGSSAESIEDFMKVCTLLHRDDSELILLVDPDKESLGIVVVDTSALWPFTVETAGF
jgi:hypothetical protein